MATPTFQDYYTLGLAEAQSRQPLLTFNEGDISEFLLVGAAAMADHLTGYSAGRFKDLYLDGAAGDALTLLANDRYAILRDPAIKATGTVTFTRASVTAGAGTIFAGQVVATVKDSSGSDVRFVTDANVAFTNVNDSTGKGPKNVTVTASSAGILGNIAAGTLTTFGTVPFDPSFTVTNAAVCAGGADEEADDSLRERVRNFPTTIRRGTLAALEYGAIQVVGVANAVAVEETELDGVTPTGVVDLYISDGSGGTNQQLIDAVSVELVNWRAAGVVVNVIGAVLAFPSGIPIALSLTVRAGTDVTALEANVKAAVENRVNGLRVGDSLSRAIVQQAVFNVDSNITACAVLLNGVAVDYTAAANAIIRTSVGQITLV